MNVTVIIPRSLQAACEGRARIELGVPPAADVADVVQTLISLYPGLGAFVASERKPIRPHFGVACAGRTIFLFTRNVSTRREVA